MKNLPVLFIFLLGTGMNSIAQSALNDCSGAVKICGDGAISTNAEGTGVQEINNLNSCSSFEHNSIWLEIEITKSGTLGFDLKPTRSDINVDYDFFIYGPNASCGNLGFAIRCSTTNPAAAGLTSNFTGMNDMETDTSEGPGEDGNSYIKSLDVLPGETYSLVIDRPIGNSPFNLEWTGTSTVGEFPFPDGPEVNQASNLEKCNFNGVADFDVFSTQSQITSQNQTSITYYESLAEAVDSSSPISGTYTSTQPRKTIFAKVVNEVTGCFEITDFDLIINEGPPILPTYTYALCDIDLNGVENFILTSLNSDILNGLPENEYSISYFETSNDAENNTNTLPNAITSTGEQVFARVETIGDEECYNVSEISLVINTPPEITGIAIEQVEVNANNNSITINLPNSGNYQYALNNSNGPFQESNIFENVNSGFVTLYIRDNNQCAIISTEIAVLGYDNFFTPNNDGVNDIWQIKGLDRMTQGNNLVYIFDRYGKLIKQIDATDTGWDGTYNGKAMPSTDYWFKASLRNGQKFNGHFSLVRATKN